MQSGGILGSTLTVAMLPLPACLPACTPVALHSCLDATWEREKVAGCTACEKHSPKLLGHVDKVPSKTA